IAVRRIGIKTAITEAAAKAFTAEAAVKPAAVHRESRPKAAARTRKATTEMAATEAAGMAAAASTMTAATTAAAVTCGGSCRHPSVPDSHSRSKCENFPAHYTLHVPADPPTATTRRGASSCGRAPRDDQLTRSTLRRGNESTDAESD